MTAAEFRRLALKLDGVEERSHMGHPDFRVRGRIFATLGAPGRAYGMVKLTPLRQEEFVREHPAVFSPAAGAWGRAGSTLVKLTAAKTSVVCEALEVAWRER